MDFNLVTNFQRILFGQDIATADFLYIAVDHLGNTANLFLLGIDKNSFAGAAVLLGTDVEIIGQHLKANHFPFGPVLFNLQQRFLADKVLASLDVLVQADAEIGAGCGLANAAFLIGDGDDIILAHVLPPMKIGIEKGVR